MLRFTPAITVVLAILLASVAGCGSSGGAADHGSEDGRKIAEFIDYFNDYKADPAKFRKSFAGKAPSNWKEYEKLRYELKAGSINIDGVNATATVNVFDESNHQTVATQEWTFTKVGEDWKLTSAPLR